MNKKLDNNYLESALNSLEKQMHELVYAINTSDDDGDDYNQGYDLGRVTGLDVAISTIIETTGVNYRCPYKDNPDENWHI